MAEYETQASETTKEIDNINMTLNSQKEEVTSQVELYKEQKDSLEKLSEKLLGKFQGVINKAIESFKKLNNSIDRYQDKIETKKQELTENSAAYYNLKNISDNKISKDIEQRIEEHLKFLEASGNVLMHPMYIKL
jgi:chromosome segregation ATPase